MATAILRPDSDVTNNWTKSTGTQGFALIDDAITQPTDAETGGDGTQITGTTTAGTTQECGVGTFTLAPNTVSKTTLWVFCKTGGKRGVDISLRTAAGQLGATKSVGQNVAKGWVSVVFEGSLSQEQINDLRVRLATTTIEGGGGANSPTVYAAYIEVEHAAVGGGEALKLELSDGLPVSESRGAADAKTRTETQTVTETRAKSPSLARSDAQTLADSLARATGLTRTEAQSVVDAATRTAALARTDSQALSDTLSRVAAFHEALSETTTPTDSLFRAVGRTLADSQSLSDSLEAALGRLLELSDSQPLTDSHLTQLGKEAAEVLALAEAMARTLGVLRTDAATLTDSRSLTTQLTRTDPLALSDSVQAVLAGQFPPLEDALTLAETLLRVVSLARSDSVAATDTLTRRASLTRSESFAPVDTLTLTRALARALADAAAMTDSLARASTRSHAETVGFMDTLSIANLLSAALSDALALGEEAHARAGIGRAETLSVEEVALRAWGAGRELTDGWGISDELVVEVIGPGQNVGPSTRRSAEGIARGAVGGMDTGHPGEAVGTRDRGGALPRSQDGRLSGARNGSLGSNP